MANKQCNAQLSRNVDKGEFPILDWEFRVVEFPPAFWPKIMTPLGRFWRSL